MLLNSITKYKDDGTVLFKETFAVFRVKDTGKGVSNGQLSESRKPYGKRDEALIAAGAKLDKNGYLRNSFYVTFVGAAHEKALNLSDAAVIEDVSFNVDFSPYVQNGEIQYRTNPQFMITDFNVKFNSGDNKQQKGKPAVKVSPVNQIKPTTTNKEVENNDYEEPDY